MAINPRTRSRLLALGLLGVAFALWVPGCASGTDALGRTVVGVPIGIDPETEGAGLKAAGGVLGGLVGGPSGAAAGTAIAGVIATALGGWGGLQARARRKAEREASERSGAERGWNEREQAAAVQFPIGGGVVAGGVAPAGAAGSAAVGEVTI